MEFFSDRQVPVILDEDSMQECPGNLIVPQGFIFGPSPVLLYINDVLGVGTCDIAIDPGTTQQSHSQLWVTVELVADIVTFFQITFFDPKVTRAS